jgi:acetate kinase
MQRLLYGQIDRIGQARARLTCRHVANQHRDSHGLSYAFLMEELARIAGHAAARGRVVLAHLGSGASMAAVLGGSGIGTSMGFTPNSGLRGVSETSSDMRDLLVLEATDARAAEAVALFCYQAKKCVGAYAA